MYISYIWLISVRVEESNLIPVHEKDDKQCLKNYRPVSLLLIWDKIFGKSIFNEISKLIATKII